MLSKGDKKVLDNFIKQLPPNCGAIDSLRTASFVPEYVSGTFNKLEVYILVSNKTTNRVINKVLETKRKRFIKYAGQFLTLIRNSFFPHQHRVGSLHLNQRLKYTDPKKYSDLVLRIEKMGMVVYNSYNAFVMLARKELVKKPVATSIPVSQKTPQCTAKPIKKIKWDEISIKVLKSENNLDVSVVGNGTKSYDFAKFGLTYQKTVKDKVQTNIFLAFADKVGKLLRTDAHKIKGASTSWQTTSGWRGFTKQVQLLDKLIKQRIECDFGVKIDEKKGIVYYRKKQEYIMKFKIKKIQDN